MRSRRLLTGDLAAVARHASDARARGYRAVKLKVGGRPLADDIARVRAVADALGPGVALRLDANRAWTLDEALRFAEAVSALPIALLEEPLADPERLSELAERSRLPLGLDETLVGAAPEDLAAYGFARTLVLKPTLLGGVRACLRWADAAHALGMSVLVSSAFESGIGTRQAVALASVVGHEPAGLDPYTLLAGDILTPPLALDAPTVEVATVLAPRRVAV